MIEYWKTIFHKNWINTNKFSKKYVYICQLVKWKELKYGETDDQVYQ